MLIPLNNDMLERIKLYDMLIPTSNAVNKLSSKSTLNCSFFLQLRGILVIMLVVFSFFPAKFYCSFCCPSLLNYLFGFMAPFLTNVCISLNWSGVSHSFWPGYYNKFLAKWKLHGVTWAFALLTVRLHQFIIHCWHSW